MMSRSSLVGMTLAEMAAWAGRGDDPKRRRWMLDARTAGGPGADPGETIIRLMVWAAARLEFGPVHSRLRAPLSILEEGSAWCDQSCKVVGFMALHLYGWDGREVAVYHCDGQNGHTVLEVTYHGGWHLFDCARDHQEVYGDGVLSCDELRAHPELVGATGHWWRGTNGMGKEGFYGPGSRVEYTLPFSSGAYSDFAFPLMWNL